MLKIVADITINNDNIECIVYIYVSVFFIVFSPSGNTTESTTVKNPLIGSTMDDSTIRPSTRDTLVPVTPPSQSDGGNTSHFTQTTAPVSPATTHTTAPRQEVQNSTTATKATPVPVSAVGASSPATTNTNSTTTTATLSQQVHTKEPLTGPSTLSPELSQQVHTTESLGGPSTLFPELSQQEYTTESPGGPSTLSPETSATTKNTPPTDRVTTSVSTPIPTKTSSPSLPPRPATSPDQASPSTASPAARTVTVSASTRTEQASGTKVAVVEVAGAPLTSQLVDTATLLAIVLFGLIFFLVTVAVFVMQAYESYKRKDYTQVDYLINGMYDSGV